MSPARKIIVFLGLLACFLSCSGQFELPSSVYARLAMIFVTGAILAVFVEGSSIGTLQPVSTRPVMIVIGFVLMGASVVWLLVLSDAYEK